MNKLSIQFHALPCEHFRLLDGLFADKSLSFVEAVGVPLAFRIWEGDNEPDSAIKRKAFAFTLSSPNLNARSTYEFSQVNPDALILEIGQIGPSSLSESWLSTLTGNAIAFRRWKKAARQLKSRTLTGAIAENPDSGATVPMKAHRFTIAAQQASVRGLTMLPFAGKSIVRLPCPRKSGEVDNGSERGGTESVNKSWQV